MAVIQTRGGGGLLGTLGSLATVGGMFIPGAQWLTPLGMGMSTVNDLMTGNTQGAGARIADYAAKNMLGKWLNPAAGTIGNATGVVTKTDPQINSDWNKALILGNQNPYGRRNAWQL